MQTSDKKFCCDVTLMRYFIYHLLGRAVRQGNIEGWAKNQDKFDVGKSIVKIKQLIIRPIK